MRGISVVERSQLDAAFKEMGLQKAGVVDEKTAVKAGKILGVDIVVIGEFQVAGDQVRISARFVEVQTGKVVSTAVETDFFQKIFMLQDAVAFSLAESLQKSAKIVATGAESEDVKKRKRQWRVCRRVPLRILLQRATITSGTRKTQIRQ